MGVDVVVGQGDESKGVRGLFVYFLNGHDVWGSGWRDNVVTDQRTRFVEKSLVSTVNVGHDMTPTGLKGLGVCTSGN